MKISEVFTPRTTTVNLKTYVPRVSLEIALARSIQGSLHSVLYGESGNGKSWLYKKVFAQYGFHYKVANCANASRSKSIVGEIHSALLPKRHFRKIGTGEEKEANESTYISRRKISDRGRHIEADIDPLYQALSNYRKGIGNGDGIIVFENLEAIFDDAGLMNELANILLLLDDPLYGELNIKFLLVGVPNGILEYFAKTKNVESVANRLQELPKVGGLNQAMVETLVEKGFNELLKFNLSKEAINEISSHIHHRTLGVAQRVQEYCERLSYKLEDAKNIYSRESLREADSDWLAIGLRQAYTVIESHLNSKQTTVARRNQVIYCIGHMNVHQLDSSLVSERIKLEFPSTAKESNMGVAGILSELSSSDMPLLRRNPKTKDFRIIDPRYSMCIRVMLYKHPVTSSVEKRNFQI